MRADLQGLTAYQVADASGLVKLDAMENPYPLPDHVREQWTQRLHGLAVNRYPDGRAAGLKHRLRTVSGLGRQHALLLGNGSDEILQIVMLALAAPGACMVTVEPGFAMFRIIARFAGLRYVGVPLGAAFSLDAKAMVATIRRERPALVLLAQPNNPTGNAFAADALRQVVAAAPGLVVIDEAYAAFADRDCLGWLDEYPNLLILRTLSKMGLAGLRLGYAMGAANWVDALDALRLPYNINVLTQEAALLALEHYAAFQQQADLIRAERERLAAALSRVPGLRVFPSQANFVLVRVPGGQAPRWHEALRGRGLLVKNLDGSHGQVADCLRITVGTPEENEALLHALLAIAAN
ncbi:MAG: histidinol-phosphate transaminase [Salinisphaera sp.]|nr:histidinol-phosphate transaminase [Salinisphaera sp.]